MIEPIRRSLSPKLVKEIVPQCGYGENGTNQEIEIVDGDVLMGENDNVTRRGRNSMSLDTDDSGSDSDFLDAADALDERAATAFNSVQELWPTRKSPSIREKARMEFMLGNYVNKDGIVTGLKCDPCVVEYAPVVDAPSAPRVCILSENGNAYEFIRRIRKALYGEVILGVVLVRTESGYKRTEEMVAIKRMEMHSVVKRTSTGSTSGRINQEDPLVELTTLQYLMEPGHRNLATMKELLSDGKNLYKIEEFSGVEMFSVLCDSGDYPQSRFSEAEAKNYFLQLINGIDYLHKKGVCHLDLSLENVLVADDVIRIIDFGLARKLPIDTVTGEILDFEAGEMLPTNKTFYLSPEIMEMRSFNGVSSDIWSCGTMLFIMLTGVPAFERPVRGDANFETVASGHLLELMELWGFKNVVSDAGKDLLKKLLVVDPKERMSIDEIRKHPWLRDVRDL